MHHVLCSSKEKQNLWIFSIFTFMIQFLDVVDFSSVFISRSKHYIELSSSKQELFNIPWEAEVVIVLLKFDTKQ